jgi:hypothetical protein
VGRTRDQFLSSTSFAKNQNRRVGWCNHFQLPHDSLHGSTASDKYRYNNRKMTDGERFDVAVRQIVGKRVTWGELTGKSAQA